MEPSASSVSSRAAGSEPKAGIKASVERLEDTVRLHAEALGQHADAIRATGAEASSALFTMEANLKAFMNEIKREIITKLNGLSAEVQQVQLQINILKGDQNVVAQQSRETAKRLDDLGAVVSDIQSELLGEE